MTNLAINEILKLTEGTKDDLLLKVCLKFAPHHQLPDVGISQDRDGCLHVKKSALALLPSTVILALMLLINRDNNQIPISFAATELPQSKTPYTLKKDDVIENQLAELASEASGDNRVIRAERRRQVDDGNNGNQGRATAPTRGEEIPGK